MPHTASAVLAALHLEEPNPALLRGFSDAEWKSALEYADRSRLTLALRRAALEAGPDAMPQWVRERTAADAARNCQRVAGIECLYRDLKRQLDSAGIDFLALKGLAHVPDFGATACERVQYDIDLYTPREQVLAARDAVMGLGYESFSAMERFPIDHLPPLIRKTGWEWRGDYFDPEIPVAVELHFRLWDAETPRLRAPGTEEFWGRRIRRHIAGEQMDGLAPVDAVGFAALHLLKHVLQRSAAPSHVLELARFLKLRACDDALWAEWRELHSPELRRLETVALALAQEWFGSPLAPIVEDERAALPAATHQWFREFARSPAAAPFSSAKDELWLHLSLVESAADAFTVARRRLLPMQLPGPVAGVHIPDRDLTLRKRISQHLQWAGYASRRAIHHVAALAPAARTGSRIWWRANTLESDFWTFLSAAVLFNLALFVFVLLYNLRLLALGFREDFIGSVSSVGTWGCVAGTLPAAAVARRFGLRTALSLTIAATAVLAALRAIATSANELLALSFVNGVVFSTWAVVMSPLVAASASEKRRASAFSVFFAAMFTVGVAGGWLGGKLPTWAGSVEASLLIAAALCATALLPALRLRVTAAAPAKQSRIYPRSRFLLQYLAPLAIWCLATGSFNPFFNAYFQRLHYTAARIGDVFSVAQLAQASSVLLAPIIFRRAGLVKGISGMMAATAIGLLCLGAQPAGMGAAFAYTGYMVFQWLSEPGLTTLLMNNVAPAEREGAAAINYLVSFTAQGVAAWGAGWLLTSYGYGPVLAGAAATAVLAAGMFLTLGAFQTEHSP